MANITWGDYKILWGNHPLQWGAGPRPNPIDGGINGTDADTGGWLSGVELLKQNVYRIITTPIGTRVFKPTFGSTLPTLVAKPLTNETILRMRHSIMTALQKWEPTLEIDDIIVDQRPTEGVIGITVVGRYLGEVVEIDLEI